MAWLDRLTGGVSHNLSRPGRRAGSILKPYLAAAHRSLATAHRYSAAARRYPMGLVAVLAVTLGGIAALAVGCGNQYRPVITPINPTGPAALPSAQITVISQPGFAPLAAGVTGPCTGVTFSTPSVITLLDFSGDSVVAQANGMILPQLVTPA